MEANERYREEKGKGRRPYAFGEVAIAQLSYVIGIDPGAKTGLATYDKLARKLTNVETMQVHQAFEAVKKINAFAKEYGLKIFVRVEDARKRKWFGNGAGAKQQGAGAIKIQCKQWEEFLRTEGISFQLVAPAQIQTKVDAKKFKMITGWSARTSNHARDAAMLVYGL